MAVSVFNFGRVATALPADYGRIATFIPLCEFMMPCGAARRVSWVAHRAHKMSSVGHPAQTRAATRRSKAHDAWQEPDISNLITDEAYPPRMTHDHESPCGAVGGERARSARSASPAYPRPERP